MGAREGSEGGAGAPYIGCAGMIFRRDFWTWKLDL